MEKVQNIGTKSAFTPKRKWVLCFFFFFFQADDTWRATRGTHVQLFFFLGWTGTHVQFWKLGGLTAVRKVHWKFKISDFGSLKNRNDRWFPVTAVRLAGSVWISKPCKKGLPQSHTWIYCLTDVHWIQF